MLDVEALAHNYTHTHAATCMHACTAVVEVMVYDGGGWGIRCVAFHCIIMIYELMCIMHGTGACTAYIYGKVAPVLQCSSACIQCGYGCRTMGGPIYN